MYEEAPDGQRGERLAAEILHALRHLEALEQRRPLEAIADPEERAAAQRVREWIRQSLLQVPAEPKHDM